MRKEVCDLECDLKNPYPQLLNMHSANVTHYVFFWHIQMWRSQTFSVCVLGFKRKSPLEELYQKRFLYVNLVKQLILEKRRIKRIMWKFASSSDFVLFYRRSIFAIFMHTQARNSCYVSLRKRTYKMVFVHIRSRCVGVRS